MPPIMIRVLVQEPRAINSTEEILEGKRCVCTGSIFKYNGRLILAIVTWSVSRTATISNTVSI